MSKGILMTFPARADKGDKDNWTMDHSKKVIGVKYQKHVSSMRNLSPPEQELLLERYSELLHRMSLVKNRINEVFDPVVWKSCEDKIYKS